MTIVITNGGGQCCCNNYDDSPTEVTCRNNCDPVSHFSTDGNYGIPCDEASNCFCFDLSPYFPEDPDPHGCPYNFVPIKLCYFGSCVWLGQICEDPDVSTGYSACANCIIPEDVPNEQGEGSQTWYVQLDVVCTGFPFIAAHPSYGWGENLDEFGNPFTVGVDHLQNTMMRLLISGTDTTVRHQVWYKKTAASFNCRGANTFTKVAENGAASGMGFPATITLRPCADPIP